MVTAKQAKSICIGPQITDMIIDLLVDTVHKIPPRHELKAPVECDTLSCRMWER